MTKSSLSLGGVLLLFALFLLHPSSTSAQAPKKIWELPLGLNWEMSLQDVLQLLSSEYHEEDGFYMDVDTSFFIGVATWVDDTLYGEHYWDAGVYTTVPWNLHELRFNFDRGETSSEVPAFRRLSGKLRAEYGPPDVDFSPDRYRTYPDDEIESMVYNKELEIYEQWQDTVDGNVIILRHELWDFNSHLRWMAYGVEE